MQINKRLDVVERFVKDADLADTVREQVALVGDMERIASRIAAARVTPRELVQLKNSLFAIELLKAALESTDDAQLHALAGQIDLLERCATASPARSIPIRSTTRFRRAV